ncbi:SIT4 phosphatase-associated family protein [Abeliophyllum distichum]|uniref:SIT4 phosphatase-associated family protein n=1 Tax=Abeliophyllum distichum TaxID=126358 RepID=A0ABD1UHF9_9LAMI
MFWRMAGLSTASPVETILDKENFTLEELLDEDEIIQECKALNGRLINFLRERAQVEQLVRCIVEEAPEDAEKQRTFKFPFIACEIFTCEVDIILKALVEDKELMNLLFSFLDPERPHSTSLAGYFSKVVVCLLLRKTIPLMNYIRDHQDIITKLIDLIGITSIMEVLVRLIGADEHIYTNYMDSIPWLEDMNVLEMIVDKFSSSDCPEVHANAAETLCAITRYAPPGLAAKISSPSFIGRLFRHALEESRPKSVLVNLLSVSISLLDPKRLMSGTYYFYNRQMTHGSGISVKPETVEGMLESLGNILKLLDLSSEDRVLLTTYGKLQPPLGKHRLKIIEFISVLVTVSSEAAEKELIRLGAVKRIVELFFEYPYNNFLHNHVENIIVSCLESKNDVQFVEHLLEDCNLLGKILEAEKNFTLDVDINKPTVPAEGRTPPRIGNIGYMTRIANKLVQLGNNNNDIQTFLQENSEWADWYSNVLLKRNAVENVFQWACGRPTTLHDRTRDSDDDDYQDRDYDVATLANNLSQVFRYGVSNNDDIDEVNGSLERDDEDVYFDDESAEEVISSLRLGDDQDSGSLLTNSNWFAFEDERIVNELPTDSVPSPSSNIEGHEVVNGGADDEVIVDEDEDLADTATSEQPELKPRLADPAPNNLSEDSRETETMVSEKPPEWVEWRENSDSVELSDPTSTSLPSLPECELHVESDVRPNDAGPDKADASPSSVIASVENCESDVRGSPDLVKIDVGANISQPVEAGEGNSSTGNMDSVARTEGSSGPVAESEEKN